MKKLLSMLLFIAGLFVYSHAEADTITCTDTADVYIDQCLTCSPPGGDTNFNTKTRVLVSYHPTKGLARSLLKFDIPAEITASQVESATLHLSGSAHTGGGSVTLTVACHALNAPFSEGADTWNSLGGGNFDAAIFSTGTLPSGNTWNTTIDVTALLTGNLDKVRDNGILIKLATEGPDKLYQSIASRECDDPANPDYVEADEPPHLEIVYSVPASTTTTMPVSSSSSSSSTSSLIPTTTTTLQPTTSSSTSSLVPTTTTTVQPTTSSITSSIIPTTTSTTTTTGLCPVVKMFNSENSREVTVIRALRNKRMIKSIDGLVLIYLYYTNSEELTSIFSADQELSTSAVELIRELTPALELSLAQNTSMTVTAEQYADSITMLRRIQDEASPRLRRTIDHVLKKLASGELLKVMGITLQGK
jgi:hypothetical protein